MKEIMFQFEKDTDFNHSIFVYENNYIKDSSIIRVHIIFETRIFFINCLLILKTIFNSITLFEIIYTIFIEFLIDHTVGSGCNTISEKRESACIV